MMAVTLFVLHFRVFILNNCGAITIYLLTNITVKIGLTRDQIISKHHKLYYVLHEMMGELYMIR